MYTLLASEYSIENLVNGEKSFQILRWNIFIATNDSISCITHSWK